MGGSIGTGRAGQNAMYATATSEIVARLETHASSVIGSYRYGAAGVCVTSSMLRPDAPPRTSEPTATAYDSEITGLSDPQDAVTTNQTSVPSGNHGKVAAYVRGPAGAIGTLPDIVVPK